MSQDLSEYQLQNKSLLEIYKEWSLMVERCPAEVILQLYPQMMKKWHEMVSNPLKNHMDCEPFVCRCELEDK